MAFQLGPKLNWHCPSFRAYLYSLYEDLRNDWKFMIRLLVITSAIFGLVSTLVYELLSEMPVRQILKVMSLSLTTFIAVMLAIVIHLYREDYNHWLTVNSILRNISSNLWQFWVISSIESHCLFVIYLMIFLIIFFYEFNEYSLK